MQRRVAGVLTVFTVSLWATHVLAELPVRIATYNIAFLADDISPTRAERIRQVLAELKADVIGLQEIKDRAALELVFPPDEWQLVIDDESSDKQDLAVAVKRPLRVLAADGSPHDLNADNEDFLFPGDDESRFPNRRDVLRVRIALPDNAGEFSLLVHHAKSRLGGRAVTDPRREAAARALVEALDTEFDGKLFVLLGDFNDNGDDRSLNILETGDPDAPGGKEEIDGPFLLNLTEALLAADHVSHGLQESDIVGDRLNTRKLGSRERNDSHRGDNTHTGAILFDQLLVPTRMSAFYVAGSAKVFDGAVARRGGSPQGTAASDHVPVYADFEFDAPSPDGPTPGSPPAPDLRRVRISALFPNPRGSAEAGKEWVRLRNDGTEAAAMEGWRLRDRAQKNFSLSGSIAAGQEKQFMLTAGSLQLTNDGDDVVLVDPEGRVVHHVSYTRNQAREGEAVEFAE